MGFVALKNWDLRKGKDESVFAINEKARKDLSKLKNAGVFTFFPPPIRELGNSSGFNFQLVDRMGMGHEALMNARNRLLELAASNPKLTGVRQNGLNDVSQFKLDIDSEKASALGLSLDDINQTLQIAWGGSYVNDVIDKGQIKRVYLQSEASHRMMAENIP